MSINYDFDEMFQKHTKTVGAVAGHSRNSTIDKNYHFYHVVQQTSNRRSYFTTESARHRESLFACSKRKYKVLWLASVVMPTHTHDLIMVEDISDFFKLISGVNRGTAVFIRKTRMENFQKETPEVFDSNPGYVPVKTRAQMMILLKYLYENPAYLRKEDKAAPLSCFEQWQKGNYKNYDIEVLEEVLEVKREDLLKKLVTLDSTSFAALATYQYRNDTEDQNHRLFQK